jgi:hypothetical protein
MHICARQRAKNQKQKRIRERDTRRAEWKQWRDKPVECLRTHVALSNAAALLEDPPTKTMNVSGHIRELTQKKATVMLFFLSSQSSKLLTFLALKKEGKMRPVSPQR